MPDADNRPLSPHLQIYRLPLTARLSIFHRATGVLLSLALLMLVAGLLTLLAGEAAWSHAQVFLQSLPGEIFLLGATFSLFFHTCNGVRHLFWDAGKGFSLSASRRSGYAVLVASSLLTLLAWLVAMSTGGQT